MDAYVAIVSRRDGKRYSGAPLPADVATRILDAGRLAGSAMNRQPWRFLLVESPALREEFADCVYEPANVRTAGLVVALAGRGKGPVAFDCGRAAQSMLLAAWSQRVASTPNGIADRERATELLALGEDEQLQVVLTFGLPARRPDPESRTAAEWAASANRKALDEVVTTL